MSDVPTPQYYVPTGCWLWKGAVKPGGYGSDGGRTAHVVAYERVYGSVERGYEIHHVCERRICVNPSHLVPLTVRQHRRLHTARVARCPKNHGYTPENTRFRPDGARVCMECDRVRARSYGKRRYREDADYRVSKGGPR